jgi:hypothetical protein
MEMSTRATIVRGTERMSVTIPFGTNHEDCMFEKGTKCGRGTCKDGMDEDGGLIDTIPVAFTVTGIVGRDIGSHIRSIRIGWRAGNSRGRLSTMRSRIDSKYEREDPSDDSFDERQDNAAKPEYSRDLNARDSRRSLDLTIIVHKRVSTKEFEEFAGPDLRLALPVR